MAIVSLVVASELLSGPALLVVALAVVMLGVPGYYLARAMLERDVPRRAATAVARLLRRITP